MPRPRTCLGVAFLVLLAASCAAPRRESAVNAGPAAAPASKPAPNPAEAAREAYEFVRGKYDRDGDGRVTSTEYSRGAEAFARLDRDRDGVVTRADFDRPTPPPPELSGPYLLVRAFGPREAHSLGADDLEEGMDVLDVDGDGRASKEELVPALGPENAAVLLIVADANKDAALDLDEVRAYIARRDRDADGRLARRERSQPGKEPPVGVFAKGAREKAPAFRLSGVDGGATVALEELRGKPVALIFGSFT
jgi:Ca2+-binding EF-hand superfamily protein